MGGKSNNYWSICEIKSGFKLSCKTIETIKDICYTKLIKLGFIRYGRLFCAQALADDRLVSGMAKTHGVCTERRVTAQFEKE